MSVFRRAFVSLTSIVLCVRVRVFSRVCAYVCKAFIDACRFVCANVMLANNKKGFYIHDSTRVCLCLLRLEFVFRLPSITLDFTADAF